MRDNREVKFTASQQIEFFSNGRRIRRNITEKEKKYLLDLMEKKDFCMIDSFCYSVA